VVRLSNSLCGCLVYVYVQGEAVPVLTATGSLTAAAQLLTPDTARPSASWRSSIS